MLGGTYQVSAWLPALTRFCFSLTNVGPHWYVSPDGSNSQNCSTSLTPCATISGRISESRIYLRPDNCGSARDVPIHVGQAGWRKLTSIKMSVSSAVWSADFLSRSECPPLISFHTARDPRPTGKQAVIDGFNIINGNSDVGGGIRNEGSLVLRNSTLAHNFCHRRRRWAFHPVGSSLTIENVTFSGNFGLQRRRPERQQYK